MRGGHDLTRGRRPGRGAAAGPVRRGRRVEPGADGLDKIRARIGGRPPQPWLLSVLRRPSIGSGTGPGTGTGPGRTHCPGPVALRAPITARNFPGWDIKWLRLVTVLAGVAVIAGIALGVSPFRQAILQASTSLTAAVAAPRGSAGTEGNGTQDGGGGGTPTASGAAPGGGQPAREARHGRQGSRSPRHRTRHDRRCVCHRAPGRDATRSRARASVRADASGPRLPPRPRRPAASPASPAQPLHEHERADLPRGSLTSRRPRRRPARRRHRPTPTDVRQRRRPHRARRRPEPATPTPRSADTNADGERHAAGQRPTRADRLRLAASADRPAADGRAARLLEPDCLASTRR